MSNYPECDKLVAVSSQSQQIGEFLDWLMNDQRIHLMKFVSREERPWLERSCSALFCDKGKILLSKKDCHSCHGTGIEKYQEPDGYEQINKTIEQLLADYFDIDLKKVEEERRAILESLRS